jgi:prepilin-type N-terminal cleavage/methylation domain-containing protein
MMEWAKGKDASRPSCRKAGMSLIEVVIAVLVLSLVLGGAYPLIVRAARLSRTARNHYVAVQLAQNRLERARTIAYSELPLLAESNLIVDETGAPTIAGRFRRTTVTTTNYAPNVTQVAITVEMRNTKTGQFQGEAETLVMLYTEYLEL